MPLSSNVHEDGLVGPVSITYPTDNDAKPKRKKKPQADVVEAIIKHNPNHDERGRFSSGVGVGGFAGQDTGQFMGGKQMADRLGVSESVVKTATEGALKDFVRDSKVVVVTNSGIAKLVQSGKLRYRAKSDHTDVFTHAPTEQRRSIEEDLFGIPKGMADEHRPVYGLMVPKDRMTVNRDARGYGDALITLKDSVKQRSTFMMGDTAGGIFYAIPSSMSKPNVQSVDLRSLNGHGVKQAVDGGASIRDALHTALNDYSVNHGYIEVQIHGGGFGADDIASVTDHEGEPFQKFNHAHDDHGRFTQTDGGPTHTVNFHGGSEADIQSVKAGAVEGLNALGQVIDAPNIKNVTIKTYSKIPEGAPEGFEVMGFYQPGELSTLSLHANIPHETVVQTTVHEYAHMLDQEQLGGGELASFRMATDPDGTRWANLGEAITRSKAFERIYTDTALGAIPDYYGQYLQSPPELFARAFMQHVATKTGDKSLTSYLLSNAAGSYDDQWSAEDFKPISKAMDDLFAAEGIAAVKKPFKVDSAGVITKYNQNHGADGRFSSGAGGAAWATSANMDEWNNATGHADLYKEELDHAAKVTHDAIAAVGAPIVPVTIVGSPFGPNGLRNSETVGFYQPDKRGVITLNQRSGLGTQPFFAVHEYAHLLDFEHYKARGSQATSDSRSKLGHLMAAIRGTPQAHQWLYGADGAYWGSNTEMFARAFAQYVTVKTGAPELQRAFESQAARQWSTEDFAPISEQFDKLFSK